MELNVWERHPPPSDVAWWRGLDFTSWRAYLYPFLNKHGTLSTLVLLAPGRAAMSSVVTVESAMYRRIRVLMQKV